MIDPSIITATIGAGGLMVGGVVAVLVKRGTDKSSTAITAGQANYDQVQEDLNQARQAAGAARLEADAARELLAKEAERYRSATADMWKQIGALQEEMERMRRQHRTDLDEDETYIAALTSHINQKLPPPAPVRTRRSSQ